MRPTTAANKQRHDRLQQRLRHLVGKAIDDFAMIEQGDRVMVCLSGGKDSFTLLDILRQLRTRAPVEFELVGINLDQKQPGFPQRVLPDYLDSIGVPYHIIEEDTYSVVQRVVPQGKTTCALCSRLRRGILYNFARQHNISKIALGHHRDDIVETLLLNLFYNGTLKAMPPKLLSDDKRNIVIRPLAYCSEADIAAYAEQCQFPVIPCNLCGSQDNLQRQKIKQMLRAWEQESPGRIESIFHAIGNTAPSQLADPRLFDFLNLETARVDPH